MTLDSPTVAIPLFAALFFLVVSNPLVFAWTDSMLGTLVGLDFVTAGGVPTRLGLLLHAALMFVGVFAYLKTYSTGVVSTSVAILST